ncbi:MAG: S41 family peptidase [Balneolaceae bacterium]
MRRFLKPLPILLIACLLIVSAGFVKSNDLFFQIKKQLTIFSDVYKQVAIRYVDEVPPEALMKVGINAMLDVLDPYTVFIDEGEQQQMEILSSGSYGGIGIDAGYRENQIVIIAPLDGYPAQRAGLQPGDVFLEIDGVDVSGLSPEEVQQLTIGDVGTKIDLKIERPGMQQPITFELERERIEINNISFSEFVETDRGIAYIQLSRFGQNTGEEIRSAILDFNESKNFNGLILDLRNNPGGLLNEALELIDKFIEPGVTVLETRGRIESVNSTYTSEEPALLEDLPVVVLMNNGSASASEVVAGAFQDLDRAVIIGEKSFGKGLVQTIEPLSYNTSLKITISQYYTPSGRSIQSVDYSDLESGAENGEAGNNRRKFLTKNGRPVYDGNGIEPDLTVTKANRSLLEVSLMRENYFFFFINQYLANNGEISKDLPDNAFKLFVSYLLEEDFDFMTPVDQHLEEISQNLEQFSQPGSAEANVEELKALLRDYKILQIYESEEFITKQLQFEWIAQTQNREERTRRMLQSDEDVLKAIELLSNTDQYQQILEP